MSQLQGDTPAAALARATPVLRSADYLRSRDFYTRVLGFSVVEEGGEPPRFGIFERGRAVVFVDAWHGPPPAPQHGWNAYLHVAGVDALAAEFAAAGATFRRNLQVTVYNMREFEVLDPDGNLLCFGEEAAQDG